MNPSKLLLSTLAAAFPLNAALAVMVPPAPFSFESAPGRLPKNVIPIDYTIAITPNAGTHRVAGAEIITLNFTKATDTIQFNSLNQVLSHVLLDGKPVKSVHSDDAQQMTTVMLPKPATAGSHRLTFNYIGTIETGPHGLFAQDYVKPDGGKDMLLSTKFEPASARRMFPCWDEPAFRATFQLSATVPATWFSVSNMPITKRAVHGALATTTFARTPKMPSYLVEYTSGNLAQITATVGATTMGVVAVKGQEQDGRIALANAQEILADYNDYFGLPYPLPKLDSIAVPGGFGGAMENWGAITYNDQHILITSSSTMGQKQGAYSVQAHEIAHQWFGDLVTMGWWDELWLNESFASWLAAKQTDARHPDWRWWEHKDGNKEDAMAADARITSPAILQHVTNELEASSAFDSSITYNKGQAVLRMLETYLGPDVFRDGIRRYMKARAYSNSTSADLWQALSAASGKDVAAVAASWTAQPGFPVVSVSSSCNAAGMRMITLSQKRFLLQGADAAAPHWSIPLQVRSGTDGVAKSVLLTQDGQQLEAGRCDEALSLNADAVGYYRVAYDDATLQANIRGFDRMRSADKIALLDDQWALTEAGMAKLPSFLALASAMGSERDERAWEKITNVLGVIEYDERGTAGHDAFVTYARSVIKPLATQMGWDAKADETPGIQRLRRTVIGDLGAWGDQEVIAEARRRFTRFVDDRSTIAPDDQNFILSIIAQNAGDAEFAQLHAIAKSAKNETELRRYYSVLMAVRQPELADQAAAIALSSEIPAQADLLRYELVLTLSDHHPALSWSTFTHNADRLMAPLQPKGPIIIAQYGPVVYWNSVPLDQLESWIKNYVPADLAPNLARGMETAHFKLSEKTMMVKAADAFISGRATATN